MLREEADARVAHSKRTGAGGTLADPKLSVSTNVGRGPPELVHLRRKG